MQFEQNRQAPESKGTFLEEFSLNLINQTILLQVTSTRTQRASVHISQIFGVH